MVPQTALCEMLLSFCSKRSVSEIVYEDMLDAFGSVLSAPAAGHTAAVLLPLLADLDPTAADGMRRAAPATQPFLLSMGTTAPACQVLPAELHAAVERLLAPGSHSTAADQLDIARVTYALHALLKPHLDCCDLPADMALCVSALLEVRHTVFVEKFFRLVMGGLSAACECR